MVAGHVSDIQILITGYVSDESVACGYVQPIIGRTAYAAPVRGKAAESHIGFGLCIRSRGRARRRLWVGDVGVGACSSRIVGSHPGVVMGLRSYRGRGEVGRVSDV